MAHVLFIVISLVWGGSFMLMKQALAVFGPLAVGGFRVLLGCAALALIWRLRQQPWPLTRRDLGPLVMVGIGGYAVPFALQPVVIRHVDASSGHGSAFVGLMVAFVPLLTIAVSVPMLRLLPTRRQVIGVVGGLIVLALLMWEELRQAVALLDLVLGLVTPLCYALANTYVKRRLTHVPPLLIAALTMAVAATVLLPWSLAVEPMQLDSPRRAVAIASLVALGVVATGLAYCWFYVLIRQRGPLFAGMVAYVIPCVALLIGWWFGEQITLRQVLCLLGAMVMVALVQSSPPRAAPVAAPVAKA